jgi:hypothetical protein
MARRKQPFSPHGGGGRRSTCEPGVEEADHGPYSVGADAEAVGHPELDEQRLHPERARPCDRGGLDVLRIQNGW